MFPRQEFATNFRQSILEFHYSVTQFGKLVLDQYLIAVDIQIGILGSYGAQSALVKARPSTLLPVVMGA